MSLPIFSTLGSLYHFTLCSWSQSYFLHSLVMSPSTTSSKYNLYLHWFHSTNKKKKYTQFSSNFKQNSFLESVFPSRHLCSFPFSLNKSSIERSALLVSSFCHTLIYSSIHSKLLSPHIYTITQVTPITPLRFWL